MRISRIIKEDGGYRLLCQFTMEDMRLLPERSTKAKLMDLKLPIENMTSYKGFWFRPRSERHWGVRGEYFVEPPGVEE